jgi:hypothetical protein
MTELIVTDRDKVEPTHVAVFAYGGMAQTYAFVIDAGFAESIFIEQMIMGAIENRRAIRLSDGISRFCFVPPVDQGVSCRVLTAQAYRKEQIDMQYAQAQMQRGGRH